MPLQDMSDEDLMLAYAHGDAAAFDLLYARHEAGLLRFVRRLLGAALAAQAEEVFQDAWMRIVAARAGFVGQGAAWRTWAFTIAHNAAMDRLRTSGRELSLDAGYGGRAGDSAGNPADDGAPLDWIASSLMPAAPSGEDIAFWRAAGQKLLQCLEALPAPQRAVFLLHHEDGASIEDMAQRLGLAFETAKSRLRYAMKKLRGCMSEYLVVWAVADGADAVDTADAADGARAP